MRRCLITLACILIAAPAAAELRTVGPEFLAGNIEIGEASPSRCTSPDGTTRTIKSICTDDPDCYDDEFDIRVTSTPVGGGPVVSTFVNSVPTYGRQVSIACGTDGGFAVTWSPATTKEVYVQLFDGQHQPRFELQRIEGWGNRPRYGPLHALADGDFALTTDGLAEEGTPAKLLVHVVDKGDGTVDRFVAMTTEPDESIGGLNMVLEDAGAGLIVGFRTPYNLAPVVFAQLVDIGARSSVGEPVQLNTFPRTVLSSARIASAVDGRFLVVWNSSRQGGRVGRYLVSDTSLTTTTSSTTTTTLPIDAGGVLFDPSRVIVPRTSDLEHFGCPRLSSRVAPDWSTFFGYHISGGNYSMRLPGIRVARSDTHGQSWRSPESTDVDFRLRYDGDLARSDDGTWGAAWVQSNNGRMRVVFSRSMDDASTWSEPQQLPERFIVPYWDLDNYWTKTARVATDGRQAWVVVWAQSEKVDGPEGCLELSPCYGDYIFATRSLDDGVTWSEPELVLSGRYAGLALAADDSGVFVLAADDRDGLVVLRSADAGATWSGALSLDQSPATGASLVVNDSTGTWLLAWSTDNSLDGSIGVDSDIVAATSSDAGKTWSLPRPVNSFAAFDGASDYEASVVPIADGSWIAAWTSHHDLGRGAGMDSDIAAAISWDNGATWSVAVPVDRRSLTDDTVDHCPSLAIANDGVVGIAWLKTDKFDEHGDPMAPLRFASIGGPCGNGFVDPFEQCDDGNLIDGDGCDSNCTATACGNEVVTAGEQCDDGNNLNSDSCLATCTLAVCGDGFVQDAFEQCDDANTNDADACRNGCVLARCGDAVVQAGVEQCDDGNNDDYDACTANCRIAYCGDGIVNWPLEQCDDGNDRSDDQCTSECVRARCGDGNVWSGTEDCDDGNLEDGDGCDSVCRAERTCGDVNGDGEVTTSDALTVLRYAVGRADACPMNACDVDRSQHVTASDALRILQAAVGLASNLACGTPVELVFRLIDPVLVAALQFTLDLRGVALDIAVTAGQAECRTDIPNVLMAVGGVAEHELRVAIASTAGFSGPVDVLYCKATSFEPLHVEGLVVRVEDASSLNSAPISPWPKVSVSLR